MAKGSALRKSPSDAASAEFAALLDESLGGSASFEGTVVKGTIVRIANDFDARVVDDTTESFVFEVSGSTDKIERCIASLLPAGLIEVSRSGIVAITRGPEGM